MIVVWRRSAQARRSKCFSPLLRAGFGNIATQTAPLRRDARAQAALSISNDSVSSEPAVTVVFAGAFILMRPYSNLGRLNSVSRRYGHPPQPRLQVSDES